MQASSRAAIWSCLAYSVMSNCMVLTNRYLVGGNYFNFQEKTFVVFIQAVIAIFMLEGAKAKGWIAYDKYNSEIAKQWAPVTCFFVAMLYTSTQATSGLPIHIVVVFKNVTNLAIVSGEYMLFKQPVTILVVASLIVMLFGALMASYSDVTVEKGRTLTGYFWMLLNCASTAGYVLYMRYATSNNNIKISKFGMAYYNNLISAALLVPAMAINGELFSIWSNSLLWNPSFLLLLALSGAMGVGLNLASFWCVSVTSATTYATVGALNKLPTTFVGVLILGEGLKPATACYVTFGMLGGILYGYAKFKEREDEKKKSMEAEKQKMVDNKA